MPTRSSPVSSGPRTSQGPDDTSQASTRDHRSYLAEMRRNDGEHRRRYEAQMRAEGLDPATALPLEAPRSPGTAFAPGFETHLRKAASSATGGTVAGTALGALCYFLGLAYLRGGSRGARNWLAAKFLNRVAAPKAKPTVKTTSTVLL